MSGREDYALRADVQARGPEVTGHNAPHQVNRELARYDVESGGRGIQTSPDTTRQAMQGIHGNNVSVSALECLRDRLLTMGKEAQESRARITQKLDHLQGGRPLPGNPRGSAEEPPHSLLADLHNLARILEGELNTLAMLAGRVEEL